MQTILYHNSSGRDAFTGNLKQKEVHKAITLHPVKQHTHMDRIHNYMKVYRATSRIIYDLIIFYSSGRLYTDLFRDLFHAAAGSRAAGNTPEEDPVAPGRTIHDRSAEQRAPATVHRVPADRRLETAVRVPAGKSELLGRSRPVG